MIVLLHFLLISSIVFYTFFVFIATTKDIKSSNKLEIDYIHGQSLFQNFLGYLVIFASNIFDAFTKRKPIFLNHFLIRSDHNPIRIHND